MIWNIEEGQAVDEFFQVEEKPQEAEENIVEEKPQEAEETPDVEGQQAVEAEKEGKQEGGQLGSIKKVFNEYLGIQSGGGAQEDIIVNDLEKPKTGTILQQIITMNNFSKNSANLSDFRNISKFLIRYFKPSKFNFRNQR